MITKVSSYLSIFLLLFISCRKDPPFEHNFRTKKIIVVVIDGPRFQETFGSSDHKHIPYQSELCKQGTLCTSFYNQGVTFTVNGHTAICTGNYQSINNSGLEIPSYPSFLQYYIEKYNAPSDKVWLITSKDKLQVLANTTLPEYTNKYNPQTDCGINGLATGYRNDQITQDHIMSTLTNQHPDVLLINYKEPDASGHARNWTNYLKGIENTDKYVYDIWNFIQNDPYYKDQTTLLITNDHGRHDDGWKDGFVSHGDYCDGCKHIALLALGPDIKQNYICETAYSQIDITATIAAIFKLNMPYAKGRLMDDILISK